VDQHIAPKSPPVHGAATDPAFVPGLMAARPAVPANESTEAVDDEAAKEEVTDQVVGAAAPEPEPEPAVTNNESTGSAGGPEFEAADRRGAIVANRTGLVFRLDDQEAEFGWSEIGAVEFGTSRYGRRLTLTVHLTNRHRYETDITARSKDLVEEWTAQLDEVLDAYFEE
jgi:hypothetical protein